MKKVELTATKRDSQGTKGAAILRRVKRVPCVLYGGSATTHFSVDEAALRKLVFTPETYRIELDIDGDKRMALLHDKQFHPVSDAIIHCDFMEMSENKEAKVSLAVKLKGQSVGIKAGGILSQPLRKLRVKGLPTSLPEHLEVDITNLELNDSIHVGDLKFPGITIVERPTDVIASVKMAKKEEEAATVATAASTAPGAAPAAGAAAAAAPAADAKKGDAAKPAAKK
ncbi:MAG: 50S ribosomal protein L25 [Flavobacteriales bacterium]|nr:50S ribosomal protein L25 [Flavobacteriales bacterium]